MKFLFFFWLNCCVAFVSLAQSNLRTEELAPYQKNINLPSFAIRLLDSTTIVSTKSIEKEKATVFLLFSPDCDHCAQLAREIKSDSGQLDEVNFFMLSPPMPLFDIKMFAQINGLINIKQITVGQDEAFFFGSFFRAETVPFVVIYDATQKWFSTLKNMKNLNELRLELDKLKYNKKP